MRSGILFLCWEELADVGSDVVVVESVVLEVVVVVESVVVVVVESVVVEVVAELIIAEFEVKVLWVSSLSRHMAIPSRASTCNITWLILSNLVKNMSNLAKVIKR